MTPICRILLEAVFLQPDTESLLVWQEVAAIICPLFQSRVQPVMKLLSKERIGAKVKKTYDTPQTPYRRLLAAPSITQQMRQRLQAEYGIL